MIYFIRNSDGSRIKIGTTIRLSERLKQLASEHGDGLQVLAVIDGNHSEEKALHRRFSHLRIVKEWFEPGDDLVGFILSEGREWDGGDEAERFITVKIPKAALSMLGIIAVAEDKNIATVLGELIDAPVRERYRKSLAKLNQGDPQ